MGWKVAGAIPDENIGFHFTNTSDPSSHSMGLE
jgi:hypothetical protein